MSQSPVRVWRKQKKDKTLLGKQGEVISWTEILVASPAFSHSTPYIVVLVQLDNSDKIYARLADCTKEKCHIGMRVKTTLRKGRSVGKEELIEYGVTCIPTL